ncbi:MAG: hypothetical protein MUF31_05250 [Akkermansiaceae bacterium]|jgi:hypothetical protein|nr:hypothetical protein [Akkermansiaceae bacterium]
MNVKFFVTGAASVLMAWLAVTYVREVPRDTYQRLGKGSQPLSAAKEKPGVQAEVAPEIAAAEVETPLGESH